MTKGRLEAFSDGVFAIVITIMVLDLRPPKSPDMHALAPLLPVFLSYAFSFAFVGIYWNNHHHLLQAVRRVTGGVLWANLLLLFCLSLIPFVTSWLGQTEFAGGPTALYGAVMLASAVAYVVLQRRLIAADGRDGVLAAAIGRDGKGLLSLATYLVAIPSAFLHPYLACTLYAFVAFLWSRPDERIERRLHERDASDDR